MKRSVEKLRGSRKLEVLAMSKLDDDRGSLACFAPSPAAFIARRVEIERLPQGRAPV